MRKENLEPGGSVVNVHLHYQKTDWMLSWSCTMSSITLNVDFSEMKSTMFSLAGICKLPDAE